MNGHRVSGSKVAAIGAHRLSLRSGRESDTKQQDGRCLSRSSLYGPDWAMFCFFLFGSEGVVFSVLRVHARTVVVVLKSENLILFLAKRKRETDGQPASGEQMIGPVPRKRLSCAVVVFCVSSSSVVSVSPLISTLFCFS